VISIRDFRLNFRSAPNVPSLSPRKDEWSIRSIREIKRAAGGDDSRERRKRRKEETRAASASALSRGRSLSPSLPPSLPPSSLPLSLSLSHCCEECRRRRCSFAAAFHSRIEGRAICLGEASHRVTRLSVARRGCGRRMAAVSRAG